MVGKGAERVERPKNPAFLERLFLPKFSELPQAYPEFKDLFNKLTQHMTSSKTGRLEYLNDIHGIYTLQM